MALQKLQVKIGGMACSFCVETIKKGLGRSEGVAEVNVSLAHEEALIAYDAAKVTATELTDTLRSLGYTVRDPNKVRTFEEEEEAELGHERDRLIIAGEAPWAGFMLKGQTIAVTYAEDKGEKVTKAIEVRPAKP